jgi:hypothetical protein
MNKTDVSRVQGSFTVVCRRADGSERWREGFDNLVVNTGLNDLLDKYFKGSSYTAEHYIGLKGSGSAAAGDTMSSHGGWSEVADYDEATREVFTPGSVSGQSVSNAGSPAVFTMNDTYTVAGVFLTTDDAKSGTDGTLYSAGDFTAPRSGGAGDTLTVTYTATAAAA